jgi:hypothetical protein
MDTHRVNVCVHTHQGILTIEWWGNPSRIQSVVQKIKKISQKLGKIGQTINQKLAFGLEHDIIRAWWVSNILMKNMLKKVWWCRHSEIKFWSWTIYCLTSCSNNGIYAWIGGSRKSHATLNCCWKGKMLLSIHAKVSKRKGHWSTINLVIMIEVTKAQLSK